jgi:hypothetical protein
VCAPAVLFTCLTRPVNARCVHTCRLLPRTVGHCHLVLVSPSNVTAPRHLALVQPADLRSVGGAMVHRVVEIAELPLAWPEVRRCGDSHKGQGPTAVRNLVRIAAVVASQGNPTKAISHGANSNVANAACKAQEVARGDHVPRESLASACDKNSKFAVFASQTRRNRMRIDSVLILQCAHTPQVPCGQQ